MQPSGSGQCVRLTFRAGIPSLGDRTVTAQSCTALGRGPSWLQHLAVGLELCLAQAEPGEGMRMVFKRLIAYIFFILSAQISDEDFLLMDSKLN